MSRSSKENWAEDYSSLTEFVAHGISRDALAIVAALLVLIDTIEMELGRES